MSTRGIQFLDVTKLPSESESFAWFLAGARYRAGAAAWLHDDATALAVAVCTSFRTARRCRLQAIQNGLLQPAELDRLRLDLARWAERVECARAAGLATVRVHADLLRDPALTPVDRRVLAWMRARGRGRATEGGLFVPNTELIAKELGIDESSLRRRMKCLGQRLAQSWRVCRDGRSRRTYWVHDPDRVVAGQNARAPENQPPGPECMADPARLHAPKLANLPGHHRTDGGQIARTPENRTGEPPPQKTPADAKAKPEPGAAGSLFEVSQLEPRVLILSMRGEDVRKAFVVDVRPASDKVCELLRRVRFAEGHPDRRRRVAEEWCGRWPEDGPARLLDALVAIAADPSVDSIAAVFQSRLPQLLGGDADHRTRVASSSVPNDHGAAIRAANDRRRLEGHAVDRERRLREQIRGLCIGDRKSPEAAANELGVALSVVETVLANERREDLEVGRGRAAALGSTRVRLRPVGSDLPDESAAPSRVPLRPLRAVHGSRGDL